MSKKVKIRFPDDTMERTVHALENLEAEGGTAVCFWCGHVYHGYSREIEKAHLLECPEYPEESKRALLSQKHRYPIPGQWKTAERTHRRPQQGNQPSTRIMRPATAARNWLRDWAPIPLNKAEIAERTHARPLPTGRRRHSTTKT